jgi:hypothetical protein
LTYKIIFAILDTENKTINNLNLKMNMKAEIINQSKAYDEIIELFANGSSPEKIVSFKPSKESQARVTELLQKNRTDKLTTEEESELDEFGLLKHLMRLVKAQARQKVNK